MPLLLPPPPSQYECIVGSEVGAWEGSNFLDEGKDTFDEKTVQRPR